MFYNYILQNKLNGKRYVGLTKDTNKRWFAEKYASEWKAFKQYDQPLYRAIRRDGWDNFSKKVVAQWETLEEAQDYEKWLIAYYYTNRNKYGPNYGYNLTDGGEGTLGVEHTEEWKQNHSKLMKNIWNERINMGYISPLKGIPFTEDRKKKLSEVAMGKPGTNIGKTFDDEWVLKISKSLVGKDKISQRRFSKEVEQEICQLYVGGLSFYKLAQMYNCNRSLIITIIDRNNIPHRNNQYTGHSNGKNIFTKEQELEICRIYQEGKITRKDLALQFKCGKTTIREILLRNNIKL